MGSACDDDASGMFFPPESVKIPGDEIELHVLAVDDSLVDRKVVERLLRTSSCKVTVAESGRKALQYLGLLDGNESSSGVKVNLILTDYSMPGMTGYELMKKIKESAAFREVPVVIMSSENILARIDRCLEEGAKDFILKPVKLCDVIRLKDFMMRNLNSYRTVEEMDLSKTAMREYRTSSLVTSSLTLSPNKLTSSEYKTQSPRCDRRRRRRNQHRL